MKRLVRWGALVLIAVLAYPVVLAYQIWDQSRKDELRRADAIVVLGAAQYDGRPSPVFRARLDHAAYLYDEGFSPTVVVTGGKGAGDEATEAEAGDRYLRTAEGVPPEDIIVVPAGLTTLESLRAARERTATSGIETVLLVTDPLHSKRVKVMAEDVGFEAGYASWASYLELNRSRRTKAKELAREVVSLLAYQLLDR